MLEKKPDYLNLVERWVPELIGLEGILQRKAISPTRPPGVGISAGLEQRAHEFRGVPVDGVAEKRRVLLGPAGDARARCSEPPDLFRAPFLDRGYESRVTRGPSTTVSPS